MALLNVLESQRNEIFSMLDGNDVIDGGLETIRLTSSNAPSEAVNPEWKVLVYDSMGQRILSTLFKVGMIRLRGVTLHLALHSDERAAVPEVPAVYFCEPTEMNIKRIEKDLSTLAQGTDPTKPCPLYHGFRLNFIQPVTTPQLQSLAATSTHAGTAKLVESVFDRYLSFVSISPTEFELGIKGSFALLNGQTSDGKIEAHISQVVAGLLSLCLTMKIMPVIRCATNGDSPAKMVARMVASELHRCHQQGIFKGSVPRGHSSVCNRPCLVIVDRTVDLSCPLAHSWSYRPLIKDLLALDANRVSFTSGPENEGKKTSHDLDQSDSYWEEWMELPFPDLLKAVNDAVEEYDQKMKSLNRDASSEVNALTAALSSLPVLTEKKRLLDIHTNLNTVLLETVSKRSIDQFYSLEEGILSGTTPISNAMVTLKKFFHEGVGENSDRWRLLLTICGSRITSSDKKEILTALKSHITKLAPDAMNILQWVISKTEKSTTILSQANGGSTSGSAALGGVIAEAEKVVKAQTEDIWQGSIGRFGKGLIDQGKGFVMQGMKAVMGFERSTPITEIVRDLLSGRCDERILTLDPLNADKAGQLYEIHNLPDSFSQGVVFVVGEGNYVESHNIRTKALKTATKPSDPGGSKTSLSSGKSLSSGGSILYGCTSFESPDEFTQSIEAAARRL